MTKISETYPIGNVENMDVRELAESLQDMYRILSVAINSKPSVITRIDPATGNYIDGQATDVDQAIGTININPATPKVEVLTAHSTPTTVVWTAV